METHRVFVAWEPRSERVGASAKQLLAAMEWLRALPELEGDWTAVAPRTRASLPCGTAATAARCLAAGAYPILPPPRPAEPEYYKQYFYLGSFRKWRAKITIVCGVRRVMHGIQAPNRFDLMVRADLSPLDMRQVLVGLISVFRPTWGFAASERFPAGPSPENDTPSVGWLTYLSSWFGAPPPLAAPALISPIPKFGTIIQAFPDAFDPRDAVHRSTIRALEKTLRASGTLRPFVTGADPR
jgi:hypothetical protein